MFLNLPYNCVSFLFPHNFCKETRWFLENVILFEKICTTAGRDKFQVCAVTTVMNSFFCRCWESFFIFSNSTSRHLFDCDWNGLAATTGIISYYHWLSRFDSLETGMDLVAPAAHVWAPHRQRRQEWARRRWPRGPVWPFCHWRLALCIRFDCLEVEKSGTLELVTIIQIRNFSTQHTVRPFIQTDDEQDHQEIPGSCCLPASSLGNGVFAKSILIVNYSLCLPLIRVNGIGTLIWLGLITNTCE